MPRRLMSRSESKRRRKAEKVRQPSTRTRGPKCRSSVLIRSVAQPSAGGQRCLVQTGRAVRRRRRREVEAAVVRVASPSGRLSSPSLPRPPLQPCRSPGFERLDVGPLAFAFGCRGALSRGRAWSDGTDRANMDTETPSATHRDLGPSFEPRPALEGQGAVRTAVRDLIRLSHVAREDGAPRRRRAGRLERMQTRSRRLGRGRGGPDKEHRRLLPLSNALWCPSSSGSASSVVPYRRAGPCQSAPVEAVVRRSTARALRPLPRQPHRRRRARRAT